MSRLSRAAVASRKFGGEGERSVDCRLYGAAGFAVAGTGKEDPAHRTRSCDCGTSRARDRGTAAVFERGRAWLYLTGPLGGHAFWGRRAAHPPGHTDWLKIARRA